MKWLSFKDGDDACEFCGNVEYDISATLITCTRCRATYGRCNGIWRVDPSTIPVTEKDSTRLTDDPVNSGSCNAGDLAPKREQG